MKHYPCYEIVGIPVISTTSGCGQIWVAIIKEYAGVEQYTHMEMCVQMSRTCRVYVTPHTCLVLVEIIKLCTIQLLHLVSIMSKLVVHYASG